MSEVQEETGLSVEKKAEIETAFAPMIAERDGYKKVYEAILSKPIDMDTIKEARELRLKLVKTSSGIRLIHKTQKAFFLQAGKFVDSWKNKELPPVEQMKDKLAEIEDFFAKQERDRIDENRAKRAEMMFNIGGVGIAPDNYPTGYETMQDEVFNLWFTAKEKELIDEKRAAKEKQDKIDELYRKEEEAKKKEAARIEAERVEREEKVNAENKRLLEERAETERKNREQQARINKLEKERKDREAAEIRKQKEIKAQIEADKIKAQEAAAKVTQEREQAVQAELNKGDAAKVKDLKRDLHALQIKYVFKSAKNKKMYRDVGVLLAKVVDHIK